MKIKKKIVILILIFSFTSAALIPPKKTNAFAGTAALLLFKAGVSFTAFTSFAHLFYVNGYHMQISDLAVKFANTYYDYANNVYTQKGSKMNQLEKLNLFLAETLSGNKSMTYSEMDKIINDIVDSFPQQFDTSIIESIFKLSAYPQQQYSQLTIDGNYRHVHESRKGKFAELTAMQTNYKAWLKFDTIGYTLINGIYYPNVLLIDSLGKSHIVPYLGYYTLSNGSFDVYGSSSGTEGINVLNNLPAINTVINDDYTIKPNSFASGFNDFILSIPASIYKLLNGKANTVPELENLINADEYLQNEIAKLLEQTQVNKDDPAIIPEVGTDGNLYYPGTQDLPENPTIPYNPGAAWYNDLIGWVASIPDVINTGLDNFWQNQLNPALDNIGQWVTSIPSAIAEIPAKIAEVTDLSGDIPMEQIQLQNLHLNGVITKFPFSIPFDYVKLLKNFRRDPIAPDLRIKLNTHYFSIDQEIDVASVNKYIVFFRWFSLAMFIYALMMITRKVIKW